VVAGVPRWSTASTGERGTLIHVDVNANVKRVRHRNAGTRTNASVLHVPLRPVLSDSHGTQTPAVVEVVMDVRLGSVAPSSDGTQTPVSVDPLVF